MELFDHDYGVDNSPIDNTEIVQMILYYSKEETKEVKFLAKELMKKYWPEEYREKGNIYDLFLKILKEKYAEHYGQEALDRQRSRVEPQRNLFD